MRTLFITSFLIIFLLSACNFPKPGQLNPGLTVEPDAGLSTETESPQGFATTECAYVWARESLPDLSKDFEEALQEVQPQANGHTEAYGENCIDSQGNVVRFLAMETDFYATLEVKDLGDKQALGEWIEQVLVVVAKFPVEDTPGPQPGYVGITFKAPGDELRLWFTRMDAETALENGLQGEELFNALQVK
jgi:hypothetical protein